MKRKNESIKELISLSKIPLTLAFICIIILSLQFIYSRIPPYWSLGFSSVVEEQAREWKNFEVRGLYKGQKIQHTFKASENNLGIILVRFYNFDKPVSDEVIFRIKESNKRGWYYNNSYKANQFQPNSYFTFGFPPISESKNKQYYFEIESVKGKRNDLIALSRTIPNVAYVYKFSKQDLTNNKSALLFFISKKINYSLSNINYLIVLFVYVISLTVLFAYKNKKRLLKQFSLNLNKAELYLSKMVNKAKRKNIILIRKINLLQNNLNKYYKIHNKKIIIVSMFMIFITAILMRISFYWNPLNIENDLIWSGLGGNGDYDMLFRHAVRFMTNNDITASYWGMSNDFPVLIRLYALFFKLFGYVNGLDYSVYFFILLSSLICLVPFIIASRLKKFSLGGFTASMLLAVSTLSVWLASGKIIDTFTSFFFCIFVILFMFSIEKRNYFFAVLLGLIAIVDSHNRGLMLLNDVPALFLFGLYYVYLNSKKQNTFPFIKVKVSNILYAFLPFFILMIYYAYMNIFFITIFKRYWAFGFWGALPKFNSVTSATVSQGSNGIIHKFPLGEFLNYFLVFNLGNLFEFIKVIRTEIIFMTGLIIFYYFKFYNKLKKSSYKLFLIPLIYLGIIYIVQKLLIIQPFFKLDLGITSLRYYLRITDTDFFLALIFLEFSLMQIFLLKKDFIKIILTILPYFFLLGYGYYNPFSERHQIQILVVFFVLFGLMLNKLLMSNHNIKIKTLEYLLYLVLILIFYGFIGSKIFDGTKTLIGDISYFSREVDYLKYAKTVIPPDGIILLGMKYENLILVSNYTQRRVISNINTYDSFLIKPGKEYFSIPFIDTHFPPYTINTTSKSDIVIRAIMEDKVEFKKYKFYVLDYQDERWKDILQNPETGHPFIKSGIFSLERISKNYKGRSIYKLVLKNNSI